MSTEGPPKNNEDSDPHEEVKSKHTPFKVLKESEFNKHTVAGEFGIEKLKEVEGKPFVIREFELDGTTTEEKLVEMGSYKSLFDELKEYGISMPAQCVFGNNESGDQVMYLVTDKIDAIDFRQNSFESKISKEIYPHLNETLLGLTNYFVDKLKRGEVMLGDIGGMDQFAFGTSMATSEKGLFLIDPDPQPSKLAVTAMANLCNTINFLLLAEEKFGITLFEVRENLKHIAEDVELKSMHKAGLENDTLEHLRESNTEYQERYQEFLQKVSKM